MSLADAQLGINIDSNKLFYAVSHTAEPDVLKRVGYIDFSFDLNQSIVTQDPETFPGLCDTLSRLSREHGAAEARIIMPPSLECWSIVPKTVFDEEGERRQHLEILMQGTDIHQTEVNWHPLSNRDFKLLSVRQNTHIQSFQTLLDSAGNGTLYSDFETGGKWLKHTGFHGSFLMVNSYNGVIVISSYLLGKLRAATYFTYDDIQDLPYLWLQYASHLPWMEGLHEYLMVTGERSGTIIEFLNAYWDDATEVLVMDNLNKLHLKAEEKSFPFQLERAFPAIMLSVS